MAFLWSRMGFTHHPHAGFSIFCCRYGEFACINIVDVFSLTTNRGFWVCKILPNMSSMSKKWSLVKHTRTVTYSVGLRRGFQNVWFCCTSEMIRYSMILHIFQMNSDQNISKPLFNILVVSRGFAKLPAYTQTLSYRLCINYIKFVSS